MVELLHKEVTSQIIAAAYEVSNQLGVGFLKKVYENAMKDSTAETPCFFRLTAGI